MNALLFCNLVPRGSGGAAALFEAMAVEFGRHGDRLCVALGGEPDGAVADRWKRAGLDWAAMPGWTDGHGQEHPWRFCGSALRLLRSRLPDVAAVHFGNELPSWVVRQLAPLAGVGRVKWVWHQDQEIGPVSSVTRRLSRLRLLASGFAGFVAVYGGGRRSMIERGIPEDRIAVIHNTVSEHVPARPRGWLRGEFVVPAGAVVLVCVASLIARKRIDFLIRAVSRMAAGAAGSSDWRLLIVGEGPERDGLAELVRQLGLDGRIVMAGRRNDVRDLLAQADVFVLASEREACPYAILEAMAAGIPAVATAAGGVAELIDEGLSGYVVPRADEAGFARRLGNLVDQPGLRRDMGVAAKHKWQEQFQPEVAARAYRAFYRRVLGQETD